MTDFFERIVALRREGQSFAVATVVARRAPVSSHLGDRAIVFADGRIEGFVGGACSREIVRQQGMEALRTRQGRLVSIQPEERGIGQEAGDHVVVPMSCASEGAVDVFIEPFVQARVLVVAGATAVAAALVRLARAMDYEVVQAVDAHEQRDIEPEAARSGASVVTVDTLAHVLRQRGSDVAGVVVASQGHYDEEALGATLPCGVPYVGLVASRARGATVRAALEADGLQGVAAVRCPAGLDLGGRAAHEVALSILAEIVQVAGRQPSAAVPDAAAVPIVVETAVDPVCHMQVVVATARHTAELDGVRYYFCCGGCRARFVKDPQSFLANPA